MTDSETERRATALRGTPAAPPPALERAPTKAFTLLPWPAEAQRSAHEGKTGAGNRVALMTS